MIAAFPVASSPVASSPVASSPGAFPCRPPPARQGNGRDEGGFILLAVLLALAVISGLTGQLIYFARAEMRAAAATRDIAVAGTAAEGAIRVAVFRVLSTSAARGAGAWRGDEFTLASPGASVVVRVSDLAGRINPNLASPGLLLSLLGRLGADADTARAMTALIVTGRGSNTGNGPMTPFQDMEDLARRSGIPAPLMAILSPHLTTWRRGPPDPRTAGAAVSAALALTGEDELAGALQPDERVLLIEAVATTITGRAGVRRAVVRLGLEEDGASWRFLAWDPAIP